MKKIYTFLLLISLFGIMTGCENSPADSQQNNISEEEAKTLFQYEEISDDNIRIKKYIGVDTTIDVPDQINGKKVTEIGTGAFSNMDVKKISIPATVDTIPSWAFYNLPSCTEVTIGNKMALKSDDIFCQCPNLKKVNTKGDGTIVWFIGNSLIAEGNLDMYFQDICDQKEKRVVHYTSSSDGYTILDHQMDFSVTIPETAYLVADIILVQPLYEYDDKNIQELRSACRKDARIYSLGTIYTRYIDYLQFQDIWTTPLDGFTPGGDICDDLIQKKILNLNDIQAEDEVHPTYLNGFISGACIYKELFSGSVKDIDYEKMSYRIDSFIPGNTKEEKREKIEEILSEIDSFDREEYRKSDRASYDYSTEIKRG